MTFQSYLTAQNRTVEIEVSTMKTSYEETRYYKETRKSWKLSFEQLTEFSCFMGLPYIDAIKLMSLSWCIITTNYQLYKYAGNLLTSNLISISSLNLRRARSVWRVPCALIGPRRKPSRAHANFLLSLKRSEVKNLSLFFTYLRDYLLI